MILKLFLFSIFLVVCNSFTVNKSEKAGCKVALNDELLTNLPLLLKPEGGEGVYAFFAPGDYKGTLTFSSKQTIDLKCPGGLITLAGEVKKVSSSKAICSSGNKFVVEGKTVAFNEITCNKYPEHVARYNGKKCLKKFKEIEIGFNLDDGRFLQHMTVCFDDVTQNTLYSQFQLIPSVVGSQINFPRPEFDQGKFYNVGRLKVNTLYVRNFQRKTINGLLGLPENDYTFVQEKSDYYLARGHLTAKADYVYGSQHRLTFYYVNAAPQWQTFNAGNWQAFEQTCREYAVKNKRDLIVYTGTYGTATLPHAKTGKPVELFLYKDGEKTGLSVPKLFWKVMYDPNTQAGIAVLGVNNPYLKDVSDQILCKDVCDQIPWIKFNRKDIKAGYVYCCSVPDLRKFVDLPSFTVKQLLL